MKRTYYLGAAAALAAAFMLLWKTGDISAGVESGLVTCATVIIPSLFPFMILAGIVAATPVGTALSNVVFLIFRPLRIPKQLCGVFFMSFLGGFPVGAKMLSTMLQRGEIDRNTAARALCFCVNAGPSFLISAVGARILGSVLAGVLLLAAQIISSLIIAAFTFHRAVVPIKKTRPAHHSGPAGNAFVEAVQSASSGIIGICAFVIVFSAVTAALSATGALAYIGACLEKTIHLDSTVFITLVTGILEVTGGCMAAAKLSPQTSFLLCAFFVSFSSFSIIFQVKSCFTKESKMRFGPFYISRLVHGGLTLGLSFLLWRLMPAAEVAACAISNTPIMKAEPNMLVSSISLIGMCTILLLPGTYRASHPLHLPFRSAPFLKKHGK